MSLKRTSRTPQGFLNVKKIANTASGEDSISLPILELEADGGKTIPGVSVHGQFPGLVPPFEEHEARGAVGYKLSEWYALHYTERAIEVARYRLKKRLELEESEK